MFKIGDMVVIKHNGSLGAVVNVAEGDVVRYTVLANGVQETFFEDQLAPYVKQTEDSTITVEGLNSLITARLLTNPNFNSLYSLKSSRIDFIPYQFRPILKLLKSDRPRILIADGVGVGKTIEAGLIMKELQARFNIKSILVICPRPLITECKWQQELREKFGEKFEHIDGDKLRYCLKEYTLEEEWPEEYQKCIIPYSLFNQELVEGVTKTSSVKKHPCMEDLNPFPKFDLVIVDEAHHIKNSDTYSYKAVKMFCDNAESITMLTATPIQLGNQDLYTLLNILRPDLIYDKENFELIGEPNPFINAAVKEVRGKDEDWNVLALQYLQEALTTRWGKTVLQKNPLMLKVLKVLSQSYISEEQRVELITDLESLHTFANIINRTRRRDIGNFTIRKPDTLIVNFSDSQQYVYNKVIEIQTNIMRQLHGDQAIKFMMTTIMRQAASCIFGLKPFLEDILSRRFSELESIGSYYDFDDGFGNKLMSVPQIESEVEELIKNLDKIDEQDNKLDELINVVINKQKMPNNKIMIFSSFRHTLSYLLEKLRALGIRVDVIHGGVKDEERVALRERFKLDKGNKDAIDVLLFSEVGCEGLDYQFVDCMVNYDLPWNPQAIEQRIGRIDRNGQKSPSVSIVNIITYGTIDYAIYDRCLSRIGIFNESIGDSEEILGDITKGIYDIVNSYILSKEDLDKKTTQLADNAIRRIQEERKLEKEGQAFFGLELADKQIKKELEDATNIHLSSEAIEKLVDRYLRNICGNKQIIVGSGLSKKLRISADDKKVLLDEYYKLDRENSYVDKVWRNYLQGTEQFEDITFDGQYAAEHQDVIFIMPNHPLVEQAIKMFGDDPVKCNIKINSKDIPIGEYQYTMYEWKYTGVKPNNKIVIITDKDLNTKKVLEHIFKAQDYNPTSSSIDFSKIDAIASVKWSAEKKNYLEEANNIIRFKKESLEYSQKGQINALKDVIEKSTSEKIIIMKKSQLAKLEESFKEKMIELDHEIEKCDIVEHKIAYGIMKVEE